MLKIGVSPIRRRNRLPLEISGRSTGDRPAPADPSASRQGHSDCDGAAGRWPLISGVGKEWATRQADDCPLPMDPVDRSSIIATVTLIERMERSVIDNSIEVILMTAGLVHIWL